jgi:transposase
MYRSQLSQKEPIPGVVEVDASFFGPVRAHGRPGPAKGDRAHREPIFCIRKRNGTVYTELVTDFGQDVSSHGTISPGRIVHSHGRKGDGGLVDATNISTSLIQTLC